MSKKQEINIQSNCAAPSLTLPQRGREQIPPPCGRGLGGGLMTCTVTIQNKNGGVRRLFGPFAPLAIALLLLVGLIFTLSSRPSAAVAQQAAVDPLSPTQATTAAEIDAILRQAHGAMAAEFAVAEFLETTLQQTQAAGIQEAVDLPVFVDNPHLNGGFWGQLLYGRVQPMLDTAVTILVQASDNSIVAEATVDETGWFSFAPLPVDDYRLLAETAAGERVQIAHAQLSEWVANQYVEQEYLLFLGVDEAGRLDTRDPFAPDDYLQEDERPSAVIDPVVDETIYPSVVDVIGWQSPVVEPDTAVATASPSPPRRLMGC
jgi:hypothetical protein